MSLPPILLHWRWLALSLAAVVVFQFGLNGGGRESAAWAVGLFLGLQILSGRCAPVPVPRVLWVATALIGGILALSWLSFPEVTDTHRSARLLKCLFLAWGVYCLGRIAPARAGTALGAWVIAGVLLWQFALRRLGHPYGAFPSPHYLGYFSLLLLPPLLVIAGSLGPRARIGMLLLLVPAGDLIYNDGSRPLLPLASLGWALVLVLFFLLATWRRWAAWIWLSLWILVGIALIPHAWAFFLADERAVLWAKTWDLILQAQGGTWFTGRGLGTFPLHFPEVVTGFFAQFSFPHNHGLELLHESGALVLGAVVLALGGLFVQNLGRAWRTSDPRDRGLALAHLAALSIWGLFSFFSFSAYSSYTLYPLGLILGSQARWRAAENPADSPCCPP